MVSLELRFANILLLQKKKNVALDDIIEWQALSSFSRHTQILHSLS